MGLGRRRRDVERLHEVRASQVRWQSGHFADAEIDRGLAEEERHELGVDVRDVQQGHLAERLEGKEVGLLDCL